MPVIRSEYTAPLLCSNAHVQTVAPTIFRKVPEPPYQREELDTPDGDFLDLDAARVGARRAAIVFHGLEGDSRRSYMMGMVNALNRTGWDAVAVNFRGCGGRPNRKLRMYHSGDTGDVATVVNHVLAAGRYDELGLVAFSLGGNALLKYLGEMGGAKPPALLGAVAISVPCDLKACSDQLELLSNRLYLKRFLRMLRKKIQIKAALLPGEVNDEGYELIQTLKEFDDRYTSKIHGFKDAWDYYEKAACLGYLPQIQVPTLLINAADDPFLGPTCFPLQEAKSNPHLFLEMPAHGGHVGFMAFNREGEYWSETRAVTFLEGQRSMRPSDRLSAPSNRAEPLDASARARG